MSSTLTEIRPLMSAEPVRLGILRAPGDKGFLRALLTRLAPAAGRSVDTALKLGRVQIPLLSEKPAEIRLHVMPGTDPTTLQLAKQVDVWI
jgi:hypothetical protein